ncbi:MAG TPA: GNAT family N-acetyltransferase [Mycobacteriales bacterium]|jgi:predicted GNAT family acetyltransferase|nr:GNAT family N-acetyltransferase [Mycobacteriales bacterium]
MSADQQDAPEVTENTAQQRFEVHVDGELAGFTEYRLADGTYTFVHTEIGDAYGGRGLAGVVVSAAMAAMAERKARVVPRCEYVRGWLTRHPEYLDLLPEAERASLDATAGS